MTRRFELMLLPLAVLLFGAWAPVPAPPSPAAGSAAGAMGSSSGNTAAQTPQGSATDKAQPVEGMKAGQAPANKPAQRGVAPGAKTPTGMTATKPATKPGAGTVTPPPTPATAKPPMMGTAGGSTATTVPPPNMPPPPTGAPAGGYPPPPPPGAAPGTAYPPSYGSPPATGYPPPYGYGYGYGYAYPPPYGYGYGYGAPPEPEDMSGYHVHDGFFMRLQLGGGFASFKGSDETAPAQDITYSGAGPALNISLGGSLTPSWVIFGTLATFGNSNPNQRQFGLDSDYSGTSDASGIGGGANYYLGPSNLFVSAAVLLMQFRLYDNGSGYAVRESDSGVAVQLMFGKEWWVSANWGLGAALQVAGAARMKEYDLSGTTFTSWRGGGAAVLFTATYN